MSPKRLLVKYKHFIRLALISCVLLNIILAVHYRQLFITALYKNRGNTESTFFFTDKIYKDDLANIKPRFEFLKEFKNPCFLEDISHNILVGKKSESRLVYENNSMIGHISKRYSRDYMQDMYPAFIKVKQQSGYDDDVFIWKRLRCLPYYYVLGVLKSGTTDLNHRMQCHPSLTSGMRKASEWFNALRFRNISLSDYIDFYDPAARKMAKMSGYVTQGRAKQRKAVSVITGDHSTGTLTKRQQYDQGKL